MSQKRKMSKTEKEYFKDHKGDRKDIEKKQNIKSTMFTQKVRKYTIVQDKNPNKDFCQLTINYPAPF